MITTKTLHVPVDRWRRSPRQRIAGRLIAIGGLALVAPLVVATPASSMPAWSLRTHGSRTAATPVSTRSATRNADRFVTVTMRAGAGDDGRRGDRDTVGLTVENLVGSALADRLTGSDLANVITGGAGAKSE